MMRASVFNRIGIISYPWALFIIISEKSQELRVNYILKDF